MLIQDRRRTTRENGAIRQAPLSFYTTCVPLMALWQAAIIK